MRGVVTGADFVTQARRYIGTPYVYGGVSPRGFDCSGLVEYVLSRMGLRGVPRTSEAQWKWTKRVRPAELQAGDLVFLNFPGEVSPGHVMIYAGDNTVIQAPSAGQKVETSYFTPLPAGAHEWGAKIVGYGRVPGLHYPADPTRGDGGSTSLEHLWTEANGPKNVARIMAAIALAESGGRVDAKHSNSDGSTDYGIWQINSVHGYDAGRLTSDPVYNARAAVSVYRSQGLKAWTTYTDGAYKQYMPQAPHARDIPGRTRPGDPGQPTGGGGGGRGTGGGDQAAAAAAAASSAQQDLWGSYVMDGDTAPAAAGGGVQPAVFGIPGTPDIPGLSLPSIPNPLSLFGDAQHAVSDLGTFLKWTAWLFSPRNILRVVEFTTGAGLMVAGLLLARSSGSSSSGQPSGVAKASAKRIVRATPPGRAVALASAANQGRRRASSARKAATSAGHRKEEKRARETAQKRARQPGESRAARRKRLQPEEIPF